VKPPNWCPAYACAIGAAPAGTTLPGEHRRREHAIERGDVEAELGGERVVESQSSARRHRRRGHCRVAASQLTRVRVVETKAARGGHACVLCVLCGEKPRQRRAPSGESPLVQTGAASPPLAGPLGGRRIEDEVAGEAAGPSPRSRPRPLTLKSMSPG
jgi:hypothetical protein